MFFNLLLSDVNLKLMDIAPAVVWKYLCRHHDLKLLLAWIESAYADDTSQPLGGAPTTSLHTWPCSLPLDVSTIDQSLSDCPAYFRNVLLDALARYSSSHILNAISKSKFIHSKPSGFNDTIASTKTSTFMRHKQLSVSHLSNTNTGVL